MLLNLRQKFQLRRLRDRPHARAVDQRGHQHADRQLPHLLPGAGRVKQLQDVPGSGPRPRQVLADRPLPHRHPQPPAAGVPQQGGVQERTVPQAVPRGQWVRGAGVDHDYILKDSERVLLLPPHHSAAGGGRLRGAFLPQQAASRYEQGAEDAGLDSGGALLHAVRVAASVINAALIISYHHYNHAHRVRQVPAQHPPQGTRRSTRKRYQRCLHHLQQSVHRPQDHHRQRFYCLLEFRPDQADHPCSCGLIQLRCEDEDEDEYFHVIDKILISTSLPTQTTTSSREASARRSTACSVSTSSPTPSTPTATAIRATSTSITNSSPSSPPSCGTTSSTAGSSS